MIRWQRLRRLGGFAGVLLGLMVVVVGGPYARVELLTRWYGAEFETVPRETSWEGGLIYLKVFDYSSTRAKVFIVERIESGTPDDS